MSSHIENARRYIAIAESGDAKREAYLKAADEIVAAFEEGMSYAAIARAVGRDPKWVRTLAGWRGTCSSNGNDLPFGRGNVSLDRQRERYHAKQALAEPEQRQRVIESLSVNDRVALAVEVLADDAVAERPEVRKAAEDREERRMRERITINREAAIKRQGPKPLSAYFWRMMGKFTGWTRDVGWVGEELGSLDPAMYERVRERHVELRDVCQRNLDELDRLEHGDDDVVEGSVTPIRRELPA